MFLLEASDGYQLNTQLRGQFHPFANEGGKLPSFSACLHPLAAADISGLRLQKQLGDYSFYEETPAGFWLSFCGSYLCLSRAFDRADVFVSDAVRSDGSYEVSYLLMQAYMYRLVTTGNFMIHAAAAVFRGQGILFCGLSGAGKSTQANLWKQHLQAEILNYDKPCVINDGDAVYAHGSPWSGKERMIKNEAVPLKAIVYVVQSKQNAVRRLTPAQAFAHIYLHNYVYPLTPEIDAQYIAAIQAAARRVPVYELSCDISEDAVQTLFAALFPETDYAQAKKEKEMKYQVKDSFQMKKIAEEFIVIPRGAQAVDFNAAVVFNEAGAFLWDRLQAPTAASALADALAEKYAIDAAMAAEDVQAFLKKMEENGMLDVMDEG